MAEQLEEIFRTRHTLGRRAVENLAPDERIAIAEIARGARPGPNRSRALEAFALTGDPSVPEVLGQVLTRRREEATVQAAAAHQLGRLASPESETILVRSVDVAEDALVRGHVAAALGRSGGNAALETLERLANDPTAYVRRQAEFARSLILHREGDPAAARERRPAAAMEVGRQPLPVRTQRATAKELSAFPRPLPGDTYGVEVSLETSFVLSCEAITALLALDRRHVQAGARDVVVRRPLLAGLVALRSPEDQTYSVWRLVLAGPLERRRFYVEVDATDGLVTHVGEGGVARGVGRFEVGAVELPGAVPLRASGEVTESGVQLVEISTDATPRPRGRPYPIAPPSGTGSPPGA